jgi:streptomycin 6-kinase
VSVPAGLGWWRSEPGGSEWLDRLSGLVEECAERWSLCVGEPFTGCNVAWVAPAELPDERKAVLKINFPEPESEREGDALAFWGGEGAARLLAEDKGSRALLLERCEPGTQLWDEPDGKETLRIAAGVLRTLWRPPPSGHRFRLLADVAAAWADELDRLPYERPLLDEAIAFLHEAGPSQGEQVVVHQDFHTGNVLRATREPWLAIDPKPLVGEREFDTASLLRDRRWELRTDPDPVGRIRRRLDQLAAELDLDHERLRGWGIAHALAWNPDKDVLAWAGWLAAA